MDTPFRKACKIEVRRVRILSVLLGAGTTASLFYFDRTGEVFTIIVAFFIVLILATHYSTDAINYRAYKRVYKWSKKRGK